MGDDDIIYLVNFNTRIFMCLFLAFYRSGVMLQNKYSSHPVQDLVFILRMLATIHFTITVTGELVGFFGVTIKAFRPWYCMIWTDSNFWAEN